MEMPDLSDDTRRLPVMPHSSSYKTRGTCNCGRRQGERDDPFDHRVSICDFCFVICITYGGNAVIAFL